MTILYMNDWVKHRGAVIHYSTPNKTFLDLANVYHQMGIKNCFFHLALHDPDLIGVNPHDENLPFNIQAKIVRECKNNFWYFLREVIRVSAPGKLEGNMFRANRSNIALFWLYFNHITTINTVIRQTGKTTNLVSLFTWLLNFGTVSTDIGLLTKDAGLKSETMGDLKEQFEYLPEYLNMSKKHDVFNSDIVKLEGMNNSLVCKLSSSSEKQAEKVGRGHTLTTIAVDECAFVSHVKTALSALTMSGNAARTEARAQGKPFGTILTTTAGKLDDRDGRFIYSLLMSGCIFTERFFDSANEEELEQLIYANSSASNDSEKKPIVNLTLTYRQMGYSDEWMKLKLAESSVSSPENIERDLFNKWSVGSQASPIKPEDAERLDNSRFDDPRTETFSPYNFILRWYISEQELQHKLDLGHHLIIGVDTSGAGGRDDTTFYVRDHSTGEIVCCGVFNEINLITLADFFVAFMVKYPQSTMIIERQHSGGAVIDNMIRKFCFLGINPFKRMYNTVFHDKTKYEKEYKLLFNARPSDEQLFIKYKTHLGYTTAGSGINSRDMLFGTSLHNMLKYTAHVTRDTTAINQILALVVKNGRVDHPPGGHDDAVVACLLSYWFLFMGMNLSAYGIDIGLLLKKNDVHLGEKFKVMDDQYHKDEIAEIEAEVNYLLELIRGEINPIIAMKHEKRIRYLYKDVKSDSNFISVEELLDDIKKEKRLKGRVR